MIAADSGDPLAGAVVEVSGPTLAGKKGAIADEKGRYAIENVPSGTYALKVTHVGYVAGTIRKVSVASGASAAVDFRLKTSPYGLEETVVSASRRAENIIDAPASISKVGWEEARRNAADNSYSSLLKNVKGVDCTQTGVFTEAFNTRGFNTAFNTRMLMLLDGIPIGVAAAFTPVFPIPRDDVQDVEVIVGPGSALYGPDAVAGIINVTSRNPRDSQGTTLALSGGARSTFKGRLRHAGIQDKWGWKISGDYQRARDFEVINTFYNADSTISVTDDPDFDAKSLRGGAGLFYYPDPKSSVGFTMGVGRASFIDMLDSGRGQRDNNTQHYQRLAYTSPRLYLNAYRTSTDGSDDYLLHTRAANRLKGLSEEEARRGASLAFVGKTWGMEARYSITPPFLESTHLTRARIFARRTTKVLFSKEERLTQLCSESMVRQK
ncbi:MAG: TonB-dependent receptor plug domain-containing protein [Candidatus Latescibacteria bacterium]|nr:TonB-dependent receptor plug domain-containing protein [Candidatus Latescibacterota bacterium]